MVLQKIQDPAAGLEKSVSCCASAKCRMSWPSGLPNPRNPILTEAADGAQQLTAALKIPRHCQAWSSSILHAICRCRLKDALWHTCLSEVISLSSSAAFRDVAAAKRDESSWPSRKASKALSPVRAVTLLMPCRHSDVISTHSFF